jgi:hypothetical protein
VRRPANDNFRRSPAWWAANLISLPALVAWVWLVAEWTGFLP